MDINDVFGLEKITEVLKYILGPWIESKRAIKCAESKGKEIEIISEALRNNATDMDIDYIGDNYKIQVKDNIANRMQKRILNREIERQKNLDGIARMAIKFLNEYHDKISQVPIERDWLTKYVEYSQDSSDVFIQEIWAKLLAEEIINTGEVSIKTLSVLSNIDHKDVATYQRITRYVLENDGVINDDMLMKKWGISYNDILLLEDAKIINSSAMIMKTREIDNNRSCILNFNNYMLIGDVEEKITINISEFKLTRAGRDLYRIIGDKFDYNAMLDVAYYVKNKYPKINISLHRAKKEDNNGQSYIIESEDILKSI